MPFAVPPIADLFAQETPSRALGALDEHLTHLPPSDRTGTCGQAIEVMEAVSTSGQASAQDWVMALLAGTGTLLRASHEPRRHEARLVELLVRILSAEPPAQRGKLLETPINDLGDLSLPCALLCAVGGQGRANWPEDAGEPAFFGTATQDLLARLLERVGAMADSGGIWSQASPGAILWFWFAFGEDQRVFSFTKEAMRQADAVSALLEATIERVDQPSGMMDVVAVRRWSRIVDLHGLEERALHLAMSAPSRADRARARRFLDAYSAGKSELFR